MTAAQTLIWRAAGTPPIEGAKGKLLKPQPGICAITGEHFDTTADAKRALGENFTDHSLWSTHTGRVGPAALWCCSGKGKLSPRTWSWVCAPGENLDASHEKAPHSGPGLCLTNRARHLARRSPSTVGNRRHRPRRREKRTGIRHSQDLRHRPSGLQRLTKPGRGTPLENKPKPTGSPS